MAHVQLAGGVGKHGQAVILLLGGSLVGLKRGSSVPMPLRF